jgi:hypothetical protein
MKRNAKSTTRTAGFEKLDAGIQCWLRDKHEDLRHGDATIFMMDGFEDDFRKWFALHRRGEEFLHPYQWCIAREKAHSKTE